MRPRTKVLLLAAIIIAGLAFFCLRKSEPSYQGKSLSEWLQEEPVPDCCGPQVEIGGLIEDSKTALQQMGTNVIPYLVKRIGTKNSVFKKELSAFCREHTILHISIDLDEVYVERFRASKAFEAFGEQARNAIPSLSALLGDEDTAYHATCALVQIGAVAMPALTNALLGTNSLAVNAVTEALQYAGTNAVAVIPALLVNLTNVNPRTRKYTAWLLGTIHADPSSCLPRLIETMSDSDRLVCLNAIGAIGKYGSDAQAALPTLSVLAATPDRQIRSTALESIKKIDGTNGFPRFFGWLASTNAEIRAAGVQALHGYALINLTSRIALTNALQDTNENIRTGASNALENFPPSPPGGRPRRRTP